MAEQMGVLEYDGFVAQANAWTEEQKETVARLLPDDLLWKELSARFYERTQDLSNVRKAMRM